LNDPPKADAERKRQSQKLKIPRTVSAVGLMRLLGDIIMN
jgi:hypothetical protein